MDGHRTGIEGGSTSGVGNGVRPPVLAPLDAESAPETVQSALRQVRPDDLDTIFDDALFGTPVAEATTAELVGGSGASATVQVGAVEWFMERDSQAAGPFRLERLRELWHQGGLDPDTLVWCEAWAHWRPLSRVPELVAALTDAGLPTVVADASVATKDKDKVASVLPSLVAEEESWLLRMKEEREQAKEEARSALLDAPSAPAPVPVPVPPPPQVVAPVSPYQGFGVPAGPAVIPALVLPMAPPEEAEPPRRGKGLVLGALMGSTSVGLVVGALLLLPKLQGESERVAVQTQVAPAPAPVAVAPQPVPAPVVQAQAPVPTPAPVPAPAPVSAQPVAPAVAVAPVAQPAAPSPQAPAPVAPPVVKPAPQVVTAAAASPSVQPVRVAAAPVQMPKVAESALQRRTPPPPPMPTAAPAPVKAAPGHKALQDDKPASNPNDFDDSLDKEFEKELFEGKKPEDPRARRTVYLPPEPGKESLSTSDIMEVVGSHKEAIVNCIETHEPAAPEGGKGRFVVRWNVQPSGSPTDVLVETDALKGTPFARCIEGAVRTWKFPQHRVKSQEPVRFPFTY